MGRWSRRLAPVFLEFVGIQDRQSVLDVGSGTGSVAGVSASPLNRVMRGGYGFQTHRLTGPSAYLCSTSSRMQPQHFAR